uniref:Uncharacterized protein n=1 Tax=Plectus sambesii TaxID=2011161 RepID=A0A914W159_9BILA
MISLPIFGLAARGIGQKGVDYTVVTSAHPQFVGNLNLFPTSRLLFGWLMASWRNIEQSPLFEQDSMRLCSQNTQLIKAAGTTPDAGVVLVYAVDGMGTVAIAGDLFMYDDNLSRLDAAFVWDDVMVQQSRRRIVCLADWLVPGHGVPMPISRATKQQAGCS